MAKRFYSPIALAALLLTATSSEMAALCWQCQNNQCVPIGPPHIGKSQCSTQTGFCVLSGFPCSPFGPQNVAADGAVIEGSLFVRGSGFPLTSFVLSNALSAMTQRNCRGEVVTRALSSDRGARIRASSHGIDV